MENYYYILGISDSASFEEIREVYLKKVKEFPPDVNTNDIAESKFKEIQEAYDILGNVDKRTIYDYNRQFYNYESSSQDQNDIEWADYFSKQEVQTDNNHYQATTSTKAAKDKKFDNRVSIIIISILLGVILLSIILHYLGFRPSLRIKKYDEFFNFIGVSDFSNNLVSKYKNNQKLK